MQNKRIFLIGFMGAGKTTLGKRLANKSGLPFVDVDQKIEAYFQLSIQSIFEKYGEAFFRKEESKMLEKLIEEFPQAILSVGGGLPCYNNNIELMNLSGTTCYLHRPAKELFHRLKNSKENRPLLTGKSDAELLQYIEVKLLEREVFYSKAKIIVYRDQQDVSSLMKRLELTAIV
nr:shikimate kinase [uncultured Brumimicrobium sp.]